MHKLYLAIISDLHIGRTARAKELCPHSDHKGIDEKYIKKFFKFIDEEGIKADYLILPGDITGKADPLEFELASTLITKIGDKLGLPDSKILFVPGNHDKDWSIFTPNEEDRTGVRAAQAYQSLKNENWIFDQILSGSDGDMLSESCFTIWDFEDLIVVGYNSSSHDEPDASPHYGLIREDSLALISRKLTDIDQLNKKIKIFLVHHHPIQYSNHIPDRPDHSIMTNSGNLMKLLRNYKFDLLLHGHKHIPHFTPQVIDSAFPLVIFGAGSFSSQLDYTYIGHANNLFHLLEIDGRDDETDCITGYLNNWSFLTGHGWKPSRESDGIMPKVGFGAHKNQNEMVKTLTPLICDSLQNSNYVKWKDLIHKAPKLAYLSPERISSLLKEIGQEQNLECLGNEPENFLLLRSEKESS